MRRTFQSDTVLDEKLSIRSGDDLPMGLLSQHRVGTELHTRDGRMTASEGVAKRPARLARATLVVFVFVLLFAATVAFRSAITELGDWGYLGAFIINGVSSASVLLPTPGFAVIVAMARDFDPLWLGVAAGAGATFGELGGYWLGVVGRRPLEKTNAYHWARRHIARLGGAVPFVFALVPLLPVDVVGVMAGVTRYPISKFLLYVA